MILLLWSRHLTSGNVTSVQRQTFVRSWNLFQNGDFSSSWLRGGQWREMRRHACQSLGGCATAGVPTWRQRINNNEHRKFIRTIAQSSRTFSRVFNLSICILLCLIYSIHSSFLNPTRHRMPKSVWFQDERLLSSIFDCFPHLTAQEGCLQSRCKELLVIFCSFLHGQHVRNV